MPRKRSAEETAAMKEEAKRRKAERERIRRANFSELQKERDRLRHQHTNLTLQQIEQHRTRNRILGTEICASCLVTLVCVSQRELNQLKLQRRPRTLDLILYIESNSESQVLVLHQSQPVDSWLHHNLLQPVLCPFDPVASATGLLAASSETKTSTDTNPGLLKFPVSRKFGNELLSNLI
ncbi:hypothetical protein CBL_12917 [Carabus blaptoides fortunei]